jgi:hypothetical protein
MTPPTFLLQAQKKGGPKLTAAQSELSSLTSDLEIQTPTIYTAYQQLEAARLDRLKETLVKWETVRSDLGRGVLEGSERGMNVLLGWEVERDVQEVARRMGGSTAGRAQASSMTPSERFQVNDVPWITHITGHQVPAVRPCRQTTHLHHTQVLLHGMALLHPRTTGHSPTSLKTLLSHPP